MIINSASILRPGESLNDVADAKRRELEHHDAIQRTLRYGPAIEDAADALAADAARCLAADEQCARAHERRDSEKGRVAALETQLSTAQRAAALADTDYTAAVDQEQVDFAAGLAYTQADVAGARLRVEASKRRVDALQKPLADARASLQAAERDAEVARHMRASAYAAHAKAKVVYEAARRVPELVAAIRPLLDAHHQAIAQLSDGDKRGEIREYKRVRETITRALAPLLTDAAVDSLPKAPRPAEQLSPSRPIDGLELYVRPGNNYGGHKAGERIVVDEQEAALQLRRDPRNGEPLGALETPAEKEAREFEAREERERPKTIVGSIKQIVDAGLERIAREAEKKDAQKRLAAARAAHAPSPEDRLANQLFAETADLKQPVGQKESE